MNQDDHETWVPGQVSPTLNLFDTGDVRATTIIKSPPLTSELGATASLTRAYGRNGLDENRLQAGLYAMATSPADDDLMPSRLDANRFRVVGNGVASPVAEWIGLRLANYLRGR